MDIVQAIPERLKAQRIAKGLSRTQLSNLSGASCNSISDYENGISLPNSYTLVQLAIALDESADYLTGLSDVPKAVLVEQSKIRICPHRSDCKKGEMCYAAE